MSRAGAKISVAETERLLRPLGISCPEVSSQLLSLYFRHFTEAGYLSPPARR